jgi:hypothetical protein
MSSTREPLGDLIAGQWERSAASQTSASASPENNRQREQDDRDRHERRAGDVSDQDEDDRDDGDLDGVLNRLLGCTTDTAGAKTDSLRAVVCLESG